MRLPSLKRIFVSGEISVELGRIIGQLVDNLSASLEPLLSNKRCLSTIQSVTLVAATPKVVDHLLSIPVGKTPNGFSITHINAAATVYSSAWDDKTITLVASANCVVQLEVF